MTPSWWSDMVCRAGLVVEMVMGGKDLVQSYEQGNAGQQNAERHQKVAVGENAFCAGDEGHGFLWLEELDRS